MALGIETNSIAPQLIQNSGQALVQGIRQIGQQISGHLTEMQTKRDLAGLAQSLQGANVQSNEFPLQLAQIASQHPMAVRDERGQMLMGILGKAHGAWQASQADTLAFQRQMQMQGLRDAAATKRAEAAERARVTRPQIVNGRVLDMTDPLQPRVTMELPKQETPEGPYTLAPGAVRFGPSGNVIATNPKAASAPTSEARLQKKLQLDLLTKEDVGLRAEIAANTKRYDDLLKQKAALKEDDVNQLSIAERIKSIRQEKEALRQKRLDVQKRIEAIEIIPTEDEVEPELGAVPAGAVAPPAPVAPAAEVLLAPAALHAAANPNELVPVINPSGKPTNLKRSQVEAALQYGYKLR